MACGAILNAIAASRSASSSGAGELEYRQVRVSYCQLLMRRARVGRLLTLE